MSYCLLVFMVTYIIIQLASYSYSEVFMANRTSLLGKTVFIHRVIKHLKHADNLSAHINTFLSPPTFHVVLMNQFSSSSPECNHSCLHTHSLELGPIEIICTPCQLFKVHIRTDVHFPRVDSQNMSPCFFRGKRKFNLAIQTT